MTCFLIRHGKDDDTVRGGWSKASLTDEGIAQVEKFASCLAKDKTVSISRIFTSDLPRASQTAKIIAKQLNLPVEKLPEFRETNNGVLSGMKNEIANERYPGVYWSSLEWDEQYPNGESPHEFFDRICNAWQTFKKNVTDQARGDIALVTHAGVINVILCIENNVEYTNKSNCFPLKNAECISVEI